jgi:hypothetical protein
MLISNPHRTTAEVSANEYPVNFGHFLTAWIRPSWSGVRCISDVDGGDGGGDDMSDISIKLLCFAMANRAVQPGIAEYRLQDYNESWMGRKMIYRPRTTVDPDSLISASAAIGLFLRIRRQIFAVLSYMDTTWHRAGYLKQFPGLWILGVVAG